MATPMKRGCIEKIGETKVGMRIGTLVGAIKEARESLLKDLNGMVSLQKTLGW